LEDTVHLQGIRVSVKTIIPEDRLSFNSFHVVRERSTDFSHTQKNYIDLRIYTEGLFEGLLKRSRGEETAPEVITRLSLGAADGIVRGSKDDEISQEIDAEVKALVERVKRHVKWLR
jgi:hypothetical protein